MKKTTLFLSLLFLAFFSNGMGNLMLIGGGTEKDWNGSSWSDRAYSKIIELAANRRVAILSVNKETDWLQKYFLKLGAISAEDIVIDSRQKADLPDNYNRIINCDAVFIKGGDQSKYYQLWKDTLTALAIRTVFQRGGIVAGTSAGAMSLSEFIYSAEEISVTSFSALQNPCDSSITLRNDFLGLLPAAIVDTHFTQRARLGRLTAFLARIKSSLNLDISAIGIDDNTALLVENNRLARVIGEGSVTLLKAQANSEILIREKHPLHSTNITMFLLTEDFSLNLDDFSIVAIPSYAVAASSGSERRELAARNIFLSARQKGVERLGSYFISNFSLENGLYLGKLELQQGTEKLPGTIIIPAPFSNQNYSENLFGGGLFALKSFPECWALVIESGMLVYAIQPAVVINSSLSSFPLLIIDTENLQYVARSLYIADPLKTDLPRQSVALVSCTLHALGPGYSYNYLNRQIKLADDIFKQGIIRW